MVGLPVVSVVVGPEPVTLSAVIPVEVIILVGG